MTLGHQLYLEFIVFQKLIIHYLFLNFIFNLKYFNNLQLIRYFSFIKYFKILRINYFIFSKFQSFFNFLLFIILIK